MLKYLILLLLLPALISLSCDKMKDIAEPVKPLGDTTIVYKTLPGVDPNFLSLDIHVLTNQTDIKAPVVIWVHGGGWRKGDKASQIQAKANLMQKEGYVFVSVNYRLSDETLGDKRVLHPAHVEDIAEAVAWVSKNISKWGGDANKMAIMGHSAGAHIVALLCTNESYLKKHELPLTTLKACASLDTEAYDIPYKVDNGSLEDNQLITNAFGNDRSVWQQASPINYISSGKGIPPFLLVERGTADRRAVLNKFLDKLRMQGIETTKLSSDNLTHEEVSERIGMEGDLIVTPVLVSFLHFVFK